jgi:hypothetical protein
MPRANIRPRERFFLAVEGQSEESFVKWLQVLSDKNGLHVHLDTFGLGGGGFKSMRQEAVRLHKLHSREGGCQEAFLIVDRDREEKGDWSIEELRREAAKQKMTVCVQSPNHEGLLLRLMPGMEHDIANAASAETKLRNRWPSYRKPMSAQELGRKFSLDDLLRVARLDQDLQTLLKKIGLMS